MALITNLNTESMQNTITAITREADSTTIAECVSC